jgi:hypothetical protein
MGRKRRRETGGKIGKCGQGAMESGSPLRREKRNRVEKTNCVISTRLGGAGLYPLWDCHLYSNRRAMINEKLAFL